MADAANAQPAVLEPLAPLTDRSNPGYLSGAEVHEIRLSFMPVNAFGKLLRFRDDRLEAAFWVSMRQWLSGIDKVATVLSWINSVVLVALFVQLTVVKGISSSFVVACVFYMSEVAILQAVVLLRVMFRAESHFRHRDATILSVRALQCMFIVGCCLAAMHGGHFNDGAIAAYVLDIKPSATVVLINMLMHRGVLFWAQFATFFLPLRFSQHAPFHTLGVLPLLLHAAFCLARDMLAQPALKQAVCALASFLTFSTQGPGRCHPLAPQIVAYSAAVCIGYVTPLYVAYVVEARSKLAFARRLGLLRRFLVTDFAAQFNVALGQGIESTVVVLLAYFNLMALANTLVVFVLTRAHSE